METRTWIDEKENVKVGGVELCLSATGRLRNLRKLALAALALAALAIGLLPLPTSFAGNGNE
ncbi:MAG TPA: hypothetical protein VHP35_09520, partial [Terriglobia bacterium]|nr:hypothetical protein [Terriglobia bacterium]